MTSLGAMHESIPGIAAMLRESDDWVRAALQEPIRKGAVEIDDSACLVVLPNFLKHNRPESPNVVRSWAQIVADLPECDLLDKHIDNTEAFLEGLGEGFAKAFREAFREALPKAFREAFREALPKGSRYPLPNPDPDPDPDPELDPEEYIPPPPADGEAGGISISNEDSRSSQSEPPPAADPLGPYPKLQAAYDGIWKAILKCPEHRAVKAPTPKQHQAHRLALARLAKLDGWSEDDILSTLRWLFSPRTPDPQAAFWRQQVYSLSGLRNGNDGKSKFAKIHTAYRSVLEKNEPTPPTISPEEKQVMDELVARNRRELYDRFNIKLDQTSDLTHEEVHEVVSKDRCYQPPSPEEARANTQRELDELIRRNQKEAFDACGIRLDAAGQIVDEEVRPIDCHQ